MDCLEIAFGSGVCGTAARERRTIVVTDVHDLAGHIECDGRSRSEIVVPVYDGEGGLIAVLDVDSEFPSTFDASDVAGLGAVGLVVRSRYPGVMSALESSRSLPPPNPAR